ncbi:hypothetical protein WMF26_40640 [Sorangium sp. So ce185]|uniref:hypothetical protein n=1 Tax=Sorangium sp. So ce185 TaxID=3133287 RepID=UPI003F5F6764
MQDAVIVVGAIGAVALLVTLVLGSVRAAGRRHDLDRASSKTNLDANGQFVFNVPARDNPVAVFLRFDVVKASTAEDAYGLAVIVESYHDGQKLSQIEWLTGAQAVASPNMDARKVESLEAPLEGANRVVASFVIAEVPAGSSIELRGRARTFPGTTLTTATVYVPGEG